MTTKTSRPARGEPASREAQQKATHRKPSGDGREHQGIVPRRNPDPQSPATLRERVKEAITTLIDKATWTRAEEIEAAERASLAAFVKGFASNFGQVGK